MEIFEGSGYIKGLDKGIRKVVIAFNKLGLSTSGSCEGHLDWGLPYPWVEFNVASKNENKRCRLAVEQLLHRYPNNEYLYIWDMGIYSGFRIQAVDASSLTHLLLLQQEMSNFVRSFPRMSKAKQPIIGEACPRCESTDTVQLTNYGRPIIGRFQCFACRRWWSTNKEDPEYISNLGKDIIHKVIG